ncbi:hypothetical protein GCM10027321_09820 [Massilia terrae]|uniref:WXG100 family type VII secretion target n=1 Tax=Massilia terrae TaxID=1811224 RepID=A0ABT2CZS8_9BURK|nr:hypothetical protein [Massilia terrae]MCS0659447.1 hypothetical protein [Massilia terrae]
MSAATITQAHSKGLRHHISALVENVRGFATELFAAHGGWLAPAAKTAFQRAKPQAGKGLTAMEAGIEATAAGIHALANRAESHSPSLSIELRYIASRG